MANADNANGFTPVGPNPRINSYQAGGTFAKGDMVFLASGKVVVYDHSNAVVAGVAAEAGTNNAFVAIYDDPSEIFSGQCSGSHSQGANDGVLCDTEGGTGAMEVNENATTNNTIKILQQHLIPGSEETGTNARVKFKIIEHVQASSHTG